MSNHAKQKREAARNRYRDLAYAAQTRIVGTVPWANGPDALTVTEVAAVAGKGKTWVKDHAEELGGHRFTQGRTLQELMEGRPTWRFSRKQLAERLNALGVSP